MNALLLSAYEAASHARWRVGLQQATNDHYHWDTLSLPPRHFDWRMRGHALYWHDEPKLHQTYDLVVATSMTDLVTLRGLAPSLAHTKTVVYFHENQFAYPEQRPNPNLIHHQLTSIYTALVADRILFNSLYNQQSFLDGAQRLLSNMPDHKPAFEALGLQDKCHVLPVPLEDALAQHHQNHATTKPVTLLWNHRWEYDKAPDRFFNALFALQEKQLNFQLLVLGQRFRKTPPIFKQARLKLAAHIKHWGYVKDRTQYEKLVASADLVISTALHDFQGLALQEAIALGVRPLAPDRLAYQEYIPTQDLYASFTDEPKRELDALIDALTQRIQNPAWRHTRAAFKHQWCWQHQTEPYLNALSFSPKQDH